MTRFKYFNVLNAKHEVTKWDKMSAKYGCVSTFQPAITCSKLTMETLEQYVKYVESYQ